MALSGYSSTISGKGQTSTTHHPVVFGKNETYLRLNFVSVKFGHGASGGELLKEMSSAAGACRAPTTSLLDRNRTVMDLRAVLDFRITLKLNGRAGGIAIPF